MEQTEFLGRSWMYRMRGYIKFVPVAIMAFAAVVAVVWIFGTDMSEASHFFRGIAVLLCLFAWARYHFLGKPLLSLASTMRLPRVRTGREGIYVRMFSSHIKEDLQASYGQTSDELELFFSREKESEIVWIPWELLGEVTVGKSFLSKSLLIPLIILESDQIPSDGITHIQLKITAEELKDSPDDIASALNEWRRSPEAQNQLPTIPEFPMTVEFKFGGQEEPAPGGHRSGNVIPGGLLG